MGGSSARRDQPAVVHDAFSVAGGVEHAELRARLRRLDDKTRSVHQARNHRGESTSISTSLRRISSACPAPSAAACGSRERAPARPHNCARVRRPRQQAHLAAMRRPRPAPARPSGDFDTAWQVEPDRGAVPLLAVDLDVTTRLLDEAVDHAETKPVPLPTSQVVKNGSNTFDQVGANAAARVMKQSAHRGRL